MIGFIYNNISKFYFNALYSFKTFSTEIIAIYGIKFLIHIFLIEECYNNFQKKLIHRKYQIKIIIIIIKKRENNYLIKLILF